MHAHNEQDLNPSSILKTVIQNRMSKKSRTSSEKENGLSRTTLDSTADTDIIDCSIELNKSYILRNKKVSVKNQTPKTDIKTKGNSCSRIRNSSNSIRLSLRKRYGLLSDSEFIEKPDTVETPRRNSNGSNSSFKKLLSTLKKTPDGPYLSKSKLRNIEQWLNNNDVETVMTPPFANLSVTPVRSVQKKRWTDEQKKQDESSIDSEVESVLKAVYGEDWMQRRCKTEPKKSKKALPLTTLTTRKKSISPLTTEKKNVKSVRRNILNGKKLNLAESGQDDLDSSILSGVKVINLDDSYGDEQPKITRRVKIAKSNSRESLSVSEKTPKSKSNDKTKKRTPKAPSKTPITPKTPQKTFLASLSVSTPSSKCHPDAQYFKVNFKTRKEELVKKLYKLYNYEVFEGKLADDMNFSWNVKLRGTAGYCYNKRVTKSTGEVIRLSRIEFSTKIVDRADRLRDTMIHELCHAASWVIDGALDGHGAVWTAWASKAMSRFPELPLIKRCHNYDVVSKYVYRCTGCGYSIKRHSKSINTERKRCGYCYGVLELLINKKRRGKGEIPEFDTTRTLPTPNKFAQFVKENYHSVKSSKANAKHSEIMKALGQKYALIKSGKKIAE